MKTIYICLLVGICSALMSSCYDDAGNYNYKDINEVRIGKLPDLTKYTKIDRLIANPVLEFTQDAARKYGYLWSARSATQKTEEGMPVDYTLGHAKNLDYFLDLDAGEYTVTLLVTDSVSMLTWSDRFKLTVASSTYMGWMVLCDEKGYARLDMVEESGETPLYSRDILSYTELKPKQAPWRMATFTIDMGSTYEIYMFTGDGCSRLVEADLSWEESNDFPYTLANPSLGNMKVSAMHGNGGRGTLLIGDGNVYWRKNQGSPLFGLAVNQVEGKSVKVAPYIGVSMGQMAVFGTNNYVLFDEENERFLRYSNGADCTPLTDFPQGYKLKFMQSTPYGGGTCYAILYKEDIQQYYIFPFNAELLTPSALIPLNIPIMNDVNYFAFDPLYPYLFYANDNQLFLYSWTEDKPTNINTPLQSFGNERITMLKYNSTMNGMFGGSVDYPDCYLLVGTATSDDKGTLRLLSPQSSVTVLPTEYRNYPGFSAIVDATYRER